MAESSEIVIQTKVRDLIFAFERQSSSVTSSEEVFARPRAKSTGNALTYKIFRQPKLEIHDISDIETELVKTETHLNYYEIYDKETHVAFQEQLFDIITGIVTIDGAGDERIAERKKQYIEQAQKLAKVLNSKLPFDSQRKGTKKIYAVARKQDQHVVKTQGYRSEVNSIKLTEGSQSPVPSSTDATFELENSEATVTENDAGVQSTAATQKSAQGEVDSSFLPSVKKLKAFFSFRRQPEDKPKVATAVTRSRSMIWKTKYREERHNSVAPHSKPSNELAEEIDEVEKDVDPLTYKETTKEIQDFREDISEVKHSVSVLKLKSLFEGKSQEASQGLEMFSKKPTDPIAIPYTEMNLGAFRLKRSLSGSYMNYVGLLNKVNLSKSASDLSNRKEDELDGEEPKPSEVDETPSVAPDVVNGNENADPVKESNISSAKDDKQAIRDELKNKSEELLDILNSPSISAKETAEAVVKEDYKLTSSAAATSSKKVQMLVSSIEDRSRDNAVQSPQPKETSILSTPTLTVHKLVSSIEKQHTTRVIEHPSEYSLYWHNAQTNNNEEDSVGNQIRDTTNEVSSIVAHVAAAENGIQVVEVPSEYSLLSENENNSVGNVSSSIETSYPDSTTKDTDESAHVIRREVSSIGSSKQHIEKSGQHSELRQSISSSEHVVQDKVAGIEYTVIRNSVVEPARENQTHSQDGIIHHVQDIVSSIESQAGVAHVEHSVHSQVSVSQNVENIVKSIESHVSEGTGGLHDLERSEDGYLARPSEDPASAIEEFGKPLENSTDQTSNAVKNGGNFVDSNGNLSGLQFAKHSAEAKSQTTTSEQHYHTNSQKEVSHSLVEAAVIKNDHEEGRGHSELSITEENEDIIAEKKRKIKYAAGNENIIIEGSYVENFEELEEEIFKEADNLENVDEEFEKLLRENSE